MIKKAEIDNGRGFDWGRTSQDYAKYRDIYPHKFYQKILDMGACVKGQRVLDMGTGTGVLPRNLYQYGADFTGIDLSENQIKQAAALAREQNMKIEFLCAPAENMNFPDQSFDVVTACQCKWFFNKYVGIHKGFLEKYRDRILYVEGDYELVHGVYLIPHKIPGLEAIGKKNNLCVKINGQKYPDSFNHEQSLVFDTEKGLVIFNSCSHGGADNIIHEVAQTFPNKKIYAIIGGFHLFNAPQAEIKRFAERMKHTGIKKIFTGHCTGKRAFEILNAELGDKVEQFYSGMDIKL